MPYHLSQPIQLAEYDPRWPAQFEEERQRLLDTVGTWVVAIEHFGSTSVTGLAAKPILDMLAGLRDLGDLSLFEDSLSALGYADACIHVPGRRLFCRGPYNEGTHHLHLVEYGSEAWEQPLRFRDLLRSGPSKTLEYEKLKRPLAALHGTDQDGYSDGKGAFVQSILGRVVPALAGDPDIMEKSGQWLVAAELAQDYGFADVDGPQPTSLRDELVK